MAFVSKKMKISTQNFQPTMVGTPRDSHVFYTPMSNKRKSIVDWTWKKPSTVYYTPQKESVDRNVAMMELVADLVDSVGKNFKTKISLVDPVDELCEKFGKMTLLDEEEQAVYKAVNDIDFEMMEPNKGTHDFLTQLEQLAH